MRPILGCERPFISLIKWINYPSTHTLDSAIDDNWIGNVKHFPSILSQESELKFENIKI